MTPQEITPENVLSQQHLDWKNHPVTIQMFKNLAKHRETFIKAMTTCAGDMTQPAEYFRVNAYGIRTLDAITSMLKDSQKFVEQSTK